MLSILRKIKKILHDWPPCKRGEDESKFFVCAAEWAFEFFAVFLMSSRVQEEQPKMSSEWRYGTLQGR